MLSIGDLADEEPLLSSRQVEILQLIADGYTTKQSAGTRHRAEDNHNHLNAIYRRLDPNLTHAVLSAIASESST